MIGKQRGGKSALCFFLAQATGRRPIYAITAADEVLPGVEVIEDILQVPKGGVCVIDDAQLFFNSMRTGDDDYMKLRNLANIIEKSNICLTIALVLQRIHHLKAGCHKEHWQGKTGLQ